MTTNLKDFPKRLKLESGISLTRDKSRLLIALKKQIERKEIRKHLREVGLDLEDSLDPVGGQASRLKDRVHHTETRFWVRSVKDARPVEDVPQPLQDTVDWVAPVYQLLGAKRAPQSITTRSRTGILALMPKILILKVRGKDVDSDNLTQMLDRYHLRAQRSKHLVDYIYCSLKPGTQKTVCEIQGELFRQEQELIEFAIFDFMPMFVPTAFVPSDPYYSPDRLFPGYRGQWNMWKIGAGADPNDPNAASRNTGWDIATGNTALVAVIDEGCDLTHPDLKTGYWSEPGAGQPGATFDWDYSTDPPSVSIKQGGGQRGGAHGTWCAGIVGARVNNAQGGIAGLAGNCQIMPLRIVSWHANIVAEAIQYAADHGADVISMSFGGDATKGDYLNCPIIDTAIQNAYSGNNVANKKVVLCAATMNTDMESIFYPAAHPKVIAVGASNQNDDRCSEKNWGLGSGSNFGDALCVVAPGVEVPTTANQGLSGAYKLDFFGTSAATPHVAGLAALLIGRFPQLHNNPGEVRRIIARSADKVGAEPYGESKQHGKWNKEMGYGRINVLKALNQAEQDRIGSSI